MQQLVFDCSVVNCSAQFVCLFTVLRQIHKTVSEIQEYVLKQNKLLKPSMIALPSLHLTLLVMHLSDEEQLNRYTHVYALNFYVTGQFSVLIRVHK